MAERKASLAESIKYFAAWGNENILRNHIAYFEKKSADEISAHENQKASISLAYYPNFAAWIKIYTELICNSLYWKLLRSEGDWKKVNNMRYGAARDFIIQKVKQKAASFPNEIEDVKMKESINLVLNLRHSFQHGGLPNRMRDLWYVSDLAKFDQMLNPDNFQETKKIFLEAEKLLKLLPQPSIILSARKLHAEFGQS